MTGIPENENKNINIPQESNMTPMQPEKKANGKKLKFTLPQTIIALILAAVITFMTTYSVMYVKYSYDRNRAVIDNLSDEYYDTAVIETIKSIYEKYYVGELGQMENGQYLYFDMSYFKGWDKDTLTDIMANLYVAWTGDTYGQYYSPADMDELQNFFNGETVGIGVMITYSEAEGTLEVLYTMDGSPAQNAGIEAGDYIVKIDDSLVSEMTYDEITGSIQGEVGSKVSITVLRGEETHTYTMVRETVVINTVFSHMAEDGITGIVKLTEFTAETPAQFIAAVEDLESKGATQFVFDLRDNPGGLLTGVLGVLSYIFPKDQKLIKEVDKYGNESYEYSDNEHTMDCPMAVLVNGNTASAAELFTINMRDYEKATIVGTRTYGKGVVQSFFNLPNGGMLKLTIKWYSSALSDNYDKIGITPHQVVEPNEKVASTNLFKIADKDDNQLQSALSLLKSAA